MTPFREREWPSSLPPAAGLLEWAKRARMFAYAPYSGFSVGAALYEEGREDFLPGCNVENASYSLSLCAERNAVGAMVVRGGRRPLAIAIAGRPGEPCFPCGACRQFLAEFNPELLVVLENGAEPLILSLADLFPAPFALKGGPFHG